MRQPDLGRVVPGALTDRILLDLGALPFAPLNDLQRRLVYCDAASALRMTMAGGRIVFREGTLLTFDEQALRADIRAVAGAEAPRRRRIEEMAGEWLLHIAPCTGKCSTKASD